MTTEAIPVFVSYSSIDRETARDVEGLLRAPPIGADPWRDERRVERDWSREIAGALAATSVVVLLWSSHAAGSRWVRHEWVTARALAKPIVPILLDDEPLPRPLENLHGVVGHPGEIDVTALAARLQSVVASRTEYDYTIKPPDAVVPLAPNSRFVGRESDLLELYLSVVGDLNKLAIRGTGVVGMGGVGKTQLVVEFVHRFAFAFRSVEWIDATDAGTWTSAFVALARRTLPHDARPADDAGDAGDQAWILALRDRYAGDPGHLIVMDNVDDPDLLASDTVLLGVAPLDLACDLLFTTRRRFDLPSVRGHFVGVLTGDAAVELLTSRRAPGGSEEESEARSVCAALGNLPLAIVLAAAYLARYRDVSFIEYRRALARGKLDAVDVLELSAAKLATRHEAAVRLTLESQWKAVESADARRVFTLAGLLPESTLIPKGRLGLLAGLPRSAGLLKRPLDDACLELEDLSLAELGADGRSVRLHPLVHDYARGLVEDPPAERAGAARRLADAYDDVGVLEVEYAERGPAGLMEDVAIAMRWSGRDEARDRLTLLADLLDAESSTFHRFAHDTYPAMFLQQLANRASQLGAVALADRARARLRDRGDVHLALLWRTQSRSPELVRTIVGHGDWVRSVAVDPTGRFLVGSSEDAKFDARSTLAIWELATGSLISKLELTDRVVVVRFEAADVVAGVAAGGHERRWHVPTWRLMGEADVTPPGRYDDTPVLSLPHGWRAAGDDRTIVVSEREGEEEVRRLRGHTGVLFSLDATADGRHLVSAGADGTIRIWRLGDDDSAPPATRSSGRGHGRFVTTIALLDDAVVTGDIDGQLMIRDRRTGALLGEHWSYGGMRDDALTLPGGRFVITSSSELEGGAILALDARSNVEPPCAYAGGRVEYVGSDREGTVLVIAPGGGAELDVYHLDPDAATLDTEFQRSLSAPEAFHWIDGAALTPDGTHAAVAVSEAFGSPSTILLFDVGTGRILATSARQDGGVQALAVTASGERVLFATTRGCVRTWAPSEGPTPRTLADDLGRDPKLLLVEEEGVLFAAGDQIRAYELETGEERFRAGDHHGTWHLEGAGRRWILTASSDWTVSLWDRSDGRELATLALDGEAKVAALTPDGQTLACADGAGDVYAYRIDLPPNV